MNHMNDMKKHTQNNFAHSHREGFATGEGCQVTHHVPSSTPVCRG